MLGHSMLVRMPKIYYVYILSSQRRVLYIGMSSNIEQRVFQHKTHAFGGFTATYNATSLVYLERHGAVMTAIRREKEMKAWRREEKIKLIESTNPKWRDLSYGWYQRHRYQPDQKVG
jgi:putative endonuclease